MLGQVGLLLGQCWVNVGLLGPCWGYAEPMLNLCWAKNSVFFLALKQGQKERAFLGPCWGHVEPMLGLCWAKDGVFKWALVQGPS